jgi:flagellar capping protein FliD
MATTSILGINIPDNTDLVKDGALAMRTIGNGFDDALAKVALNDRTATYTAVATDNRNVLVRMNVSTANDFQIPTDANVNFPIGSVINVTQLGTGATTIKAVTPGTTTVNSTGATPASPQLRVRYSAASCIKTAANTWLVVGDVI